MGLMDKVKQSAEVGLNKASEAAEKGQAKLDAAQARHRADGLLRDLGASVYGERAGRMSAADSAATVDRIVIELQQYESEYGPLPS